MKVRHTKTSDGGLSIKVIGRSSTAVDRAFWQIHFCYSNAVRVRVHVCASAASSDLPCTSPLLTIPQEMDPQCQILTSQLRISSGRFRIVCLVSIDPTIQSTTPKEVRGFQALSSEREIVNRPVSETGSRTQADNHGDNRLGEIISRG
jgi:hypothetical protein